MIFSKNYDGPCPTGCPDRKVGCHNAATCERWAAHEAKKRERKEAGIRREQSRRMSWAARKAAEAK